MNLLFGLALLGLVAIPLIIAIQRSTELFCLEITDGRARFVRGRMPQGLFNEMSDVIRRGRIQRGRVRARVEGGSPRLVVDGNIDQATEQQLRNVLGTFRLAQIRAGNRPR